MTLERELNYFNRHRGEFVAGHDGKYAVIRGEAVAGFWDTLEDALQAGCREYGLEPFLIEKVELVEPVHFIRGLPVFAS